MFEPKDIAADVLGPKDEEEAPEAEASDSEAAADDVLAAIDANDRGALVEALEMLWRSFEGKPHAEGGK